MTGSFRVQIYKKTWNKVIFVELGFFEAVCREDYFTVSFLDAEPEGVVAVTM